MEKEKRGKPKTKVSKKAEAVGNESLQKDTLDDGRTPSGPLLPPPGRSGSTSEVFYFARTTHFKDVHTRKLTELLEAFHMFDFDRDGVIGHQDLKKTFASLCVTVEEEEIQQMLSEALSPLNFDAFVILLGCRTLELDPEEVLLDALSNWDDQNCGLILHDKLMHHIVAWGDRFTKEEVCVYNRFLGEWQKAGWPQVRITGFAGKQPYVPLGNT